jgi:hypothetical protein
MFLAAEKNLPLGSISAANTGMTHLEQQLSQEHLRVVRHRFAQHVLVAELSALMRHNARLLIPCLVKPMQIATASESDAARMRIVVRVGEVVQCRYPMAMRRKEGWGKR